MSGNPNGYETWLRAHDPDDDGLREFPLILDDDDQLLSAVVDQVDETSTSLATGSTITINSVLLGQLNPPWRGANWTFVVYFHGGSGMTEAYFRGRYRTAKLGQRDWTMRLAIKQS